MAKEDFCFTYYDGDAARDKAHMTRLERGAYDDLISAQRKRGHLSVDDIKRVLSKDFETCWPSLEWILIKDEAGKYFIEWVDKSLEKMRRQSEKQKENVSKRWHKEDDTTVIPPYNNGIDSEIPLENGDGNGYEDEKGNKNGSEKFLIPQMFAIYKKNLPNYPGSVNHDYKPLLSIAEFLCEQAGKLGPPQKHTDDVLTAWSSMCLVIKADNFYSQKSLKTISTHIQEILQNSLNGKKSNSRSPKVSTDELKEAHARRFRTAGQAGG